MTAIRSFLNTTTQALNAQSQAIRVTGENIANVHTEGYTKKRSEFVTSGNDSALGISTGVEVERIIRTTDKFLANTLRDRKGELAFQQERAEILGRAELPFSLDNREGQIGTAMGDFYAALEDLSLNPADLALRSQVVSAGEELTSSIRDTYNQLASLQREADDRVAFSVGEINAITSEIANLNGIIGRFEGGTNGAQEALDLRDQRDQLLTELSEIIGIDVVEQSDKTVTVTLPNGFALVNGTNSRDLKYTKVPETTDPVTAYPPGLDGGAMGHIVFDYGAGAASEVDLTQAILNSGKGRLTGLLSVRGVQSATDTSTFDTNGDLVDIAAQVEHISRDLLTRFNTVYLGPDLDGGTPGHQASTVDLNGNDPTTIGKVAGAFALFSFDNAANFVGNGDIDGDGLATATDLTAIVTAGGNESFSRGLNFNLSDGSQVAAGADLDNVTGGVQSAPGDAQNIENLLTARGATVTYNGLGSQSTTTTIDNLYNVITASIGDKSAAASNAQQIATVNKDQTQELFTSLAGVNLDEEFANLISFQRSYEAAARLIRVGDELFQEIINFF